MGWQQILQMTPRSGASGEDLRAWYADLLARHAQATPLELAILGGYLARTPGLAFLAGYQAALRALWPQASERLGAFCVTEQRNLRPADIATRLGESGLNGRKDFVTGGAAADWLLVSARVEAEGEAPRLAVLALESSGRGVSIEPGPSLPMLPDVPHARLQLSDAAAELLPGDGWQDYVKPFRTLEDLHVLAALSAWAYAVGCEQDWALDLRLRLLALLSGFAGLQPSQLHSPGGHLQLAGLSASFNALRPALDQAFAAGPQAECWQRDRRVLDLAQVARGKRLEKALQALAAAGHPLC